MTRRLTVPEDHIALVLSAQLADELMALMTLIRKSGKTLRFDFDDEGKSATKEICGDVMLALLEAREA